MHQLRNFWKLWAALPLLGLLVAGPPARAGSVLPTYGAVSLLVYDEAFTTVVNLQSGVPLDGPGTHRLDTLGTLPGTAIVSFDPDPRVSYELTIRNTTAGPIQGALALEIPIVPESGQPSAYTRQDAQADEAGGAVSMTAQTLATLVEDVGPNGRDTFLESLVLSASATDSALIRLTAGPETIPSAKSGAYARFAIQLSFTLEAGDVGFFGGSASFPDPVGGCDDYLDNDGDGLVDFADGDPGCDSSWDSTERALELPCDDGFDDDGDGWIDAVFDPGCRDPAWFSESPACQNGIDDEGDGLVDFDGGASAGVPVAFQTAPDPECSDGGVAVGWKDREQPPKQSVGCGLGPELWPVLVALAGLRRRRSA